MSNTPEKYIAKLRHVALERDERAAIRDEIVAYMRFHPIRLEALTSGAPTTSWFSWFSHHVGGAVVGLASVLVLVAGVTYAAEGSVPGNSLYPVKVSVSEEVRGWFAFGDEAKAMWEARRAERRLEEAETLAVAGSLSDEMRVTIATQLDVHAKAAATRLGRLASADRARIAARVSSELESSLRAHEHILLSFEEESDEPDESMMMTIEASDMADEPQTSSATAKVRVATAGVSPLVAQVRLSLEDIVAIRVQAEGGFVAVEKAVLDEEFAAAAQAVATARTVLELREDALEGKIALEARARLIDAEESLDAADKLMQDEKSAEALVELHTAVRAANEARILARTTARTEDDELLEIDPFEEPTSATSTGSSTPSAAATSTESSQGASIIDVFIDTNVNTSTGTSSSTSQGKSADTSTNGAKVNTGVNIKINTGGL